MLQKKSMTAEQLKADYPDLYTELTSMNSQKVTELTTQVTNLTAKEADLTAKLTAVTAEKDKLLVHQKIRENGKRLGLPTYAESLISENKGLEEALTSMIEKLSTEGKESNELPTIFKKTGSKPAGTGSSDDLTVPKTYDEAKAAMSKIDPSLKGRDLAVATRKKFPNIDFSADSREEE